MRRDVQVAIFTEGSREIGLGHISRCLALAEAFKAKESEVRFLVRGDETGKILLSGWKVKFFNWESEASHTEAFLAGTTVAVVDSYTAAPEFYTFVTKRVPITLFLDDFFRLPYPEQAFILNSTAEPDENPRHLFGLEYALLRSAFWKVPKREVKREVKRVLVTFGGEDLRGLTPAAVSAVREVFPEAECAVVIGPAFSKTDFAFDNNLVKLYRNLLAEKMRNLMLASDIAVSAGGQTLFELARTGTPTVVVEVGPDQEKNIVKLSKAGFLSVAGRWDDKNLFMAVKSRLMELKSPILRKKQAYAGQAAIDGLGARRVAEKILKEARKCSV